MTHNSDSLLVVFVADHLDRVSKYIEAARNKEVNEDYSFCVMRERGQEILACQDHNIDYIIFSIQEDYVKSFVTGVDSSLAITMKNRKLFFRGAIAPVIKAKDLIKTQLGNNVEFLVNESVVYWPEVVEHSFLKRNVSITTVEDFYSEMSNHEYPFFIKTSYLTGHDKFAEKYHALIYSSEDVNNFFLALMHLPESYKLFKSDIIDINHDGFGKQEYRCWISNNQVSSISRYSDYDYIRVPATIREFAKEFVEKHSKVLPSYYVVDVALLETGEPVVIELNNIESAGRYIDNDLVKFVEMTNV